MASVLDVAKCPVCNFPLTARMAIKGPTFFCRCTNHREPNANHNTSRKTRPAIATETVASPWYLNLLKASRNSTQAATRQGRPLCTRRLGKV